MCVFRLPIFENIPIIFYWVPVSFLVGFLPSVLKMSIRSSLLIVLFGSYICLLIFTLFVLCIMKTYPIITVDFTAFIFNMPCVVLLILNI